MIREILHFFRHVPGVVRMSLHSSQAELFDALMERADAGGFATRRASLVADLHGEILEIGCGTGRMFPHYDSSIRLTAIEPHEKFLDVARVRAGDARATITLRAANALDLPFAESSFDAVVIASVLCSVASVERTLAEVRRVLRPGGQLRLVEHVCSGRPLPGLLMHLFNPLWRLWNRQGCNMNRRVVGPLRAAGFRLVDIETFQMYCPGLPAFPSQQIRAVR